MVILKLLYILNVSANGIELVENTRCVKFRFFKNYLAQRAESNFFKIKHIGDYNKLNLFN